MYDTIRGWSKQSSKDQPYLTLTANVPKEDYTHFRAKLDANTKTVNVLVITDMGCQSCLAGMNMAHALGQRQKDLIPIKMKMNAANREAIGILGVFFVGQKEPNRRQVPDAPDMLCNGRQQKILHLQRSLS